MSFDQIKVELQETMGSDRAIAEAAWTSSLTNEGKKTRKYADVIRVVQMMAEEKHGTPFEYAVFRFWMRIPINTDRQMVKYRIASHNGMSGRYRTMPSDFYTLPDEITDLLKISDVNPDFYDIVCIQANRLYNEVLVKLKASEKAGTISNAQYKRAREVVRGVLPQANMTETTMMFNLRSLSNVFKQRISEHAQPEIRNLAEKMLQCVKDSDICPVAIQYLEEGGWQI